MSVTVSTWAWKQNLDPKLKLVLLKLADSSNDEGITWPSVRTLIPDLGMSRSAVNRALTKLSETGYLTIEQRRRANGSRASSYYRLKVPWIAAADGDNAGDNPLTGGDNSGGVVHPGGPGVVHPERTTTRTKAAVEANASTGGDEPEKIENRGSPLVQFFVDETRRVTGADPLDNAKARMGRHAAQLLKQGASEDVVRAAITEVVEAGLMVGAVLSVADQKQRGGFRGFKPETPAGPPPGPPEKRARSWVENVGWEYDDVALIEDLGRLFGLEGKAKAPLVDYAHQLQTRRGGRRQPE